MSGTTYKGPINPNPKDDEASIIIYSYVPALALGIIGVVTFAIVVSFQASYIATRRGTRWFHSLLLVGALMEIGGYAARMASHKRPFVVGSFVAQYFLIVVAPVLFSAAIYLSLSLATKGYKGSERLLLISPKKVLIFFVTADVVTTIIQVVGAALIGTSESAKVRGNPSSVTPEQANDILLAGLAIQCFSFTIFLSILILAIYRSYSPNYLSLSQPTLVKQFRLFLYLILTTSLLILLRTTFRLAETGQGFFGFASTHEALFGCLEYLPVILALFVWSLLPPSRFLRRLEDVDRERLDSNADGHSGFQTSQVRRDQV
ncbi:uncharacterized protein I303_103522 [Kwoniella dejecticola CBS 10117]|uniref:RTA1-domain-containing protein n=1 Tax=Kwoniella dejecticola CBS 10117 TaxID=1296121 RepID=A0A1A6A705_9TREE|nr:uncharacterized protein I303_03546 [Kwoniella dejecticola CBS 10117]OBR85833.1 hypothetical protein I303_03546 [Kwoniella dejecticola CBS 10117]